ncbi:NAD(P)H-dependent oxidoreductase [Kitasatospora nipponensis]|uniref:NAD(P)H-dependent oxidoreductase n=1 Tax=Kitasatospora nipponensis TaxID=258049 RepID=A0ABN1VRM4_9ACTN
MTAHPADRRFLFVLGSARPHGNSEALAREAAAQLPAEVEQRWLRLSELPLEPFADIRHDGDGRYPEPRPNARLLLDATLAATDVVIVSPLYWYSVSAATKLYLDHWSGWMRVPGVGFKAAMAGKTLWGVTALSTDDHGPADPLTGMLDLTAGYLSMRWGGTLTGTAVKQGQIQEDVKALDRARSFFS